MRALDWSLTELGPPETWPQSLRTAVSICLGSSFPILLWWGPHYIKLYNDAYSTIISDKHPRALGQPGKEVWAEIWDIIGPMLDSAYAGNATRSNDLMLPLERKGYREETYFTFAYSPIANDTGGPGGVFSAIMETTERVLSERRLHNLRELGARAAAARSADEVCARAAETLAENPNDVPFALIYLRDPNGDSAHLAGAVGLDRYPVKAPAAVHRDIQTGFGKGCETPESGLEVALPQSALVLPISVPGQSEAYGFIVGGISPHLQLDADYRGFYQLAARHLAAAISNVRALEAERQRTAALAEIDRAKTTFFSNISHEFRTPLTLMLAPTEEALANGTAISGSDLEMVHRNELRLMRLVNTLLDFSRIEAGRVQPRLQAIDLAAYTAELASLFRSALDTANIRLKVDCPPGLEPVAVDPEMWEKIVLNLLSNAFKHTFAGEIEVRLRVENGNATLTVRDTGVGIAPEHLPRIFERFHRIEHARGRTQEGSGIGLALVQELTKLHGGTVAVESKLDQGSTFCVTLPARERAAVNAAASDVAKSRHADAFLDEALRWSGAAPKDVAVSAGETGLSTTAPSAARARILVADDNADMREYLVRLLNPSYDVIPVADGETALYVARQTLPDLILTDVMMPGLDGLSLIRELRQGQTRTIPVIMLSARAGEEARVKGIQHGADDYLVKPFSARELLARVDAHLKLATIRNQAAEQTRSNEERFRAFVTATADVIFSMSPDWHEMRHLRGKDFIADTESPTGDWLEKYIFPEDQQFVWAEIQKAIDAKGKFELEHRVRRVDGTVGWTHSRAVPILDREGNIIEWFVAARDITDRKQVESILDRYRLLADSTRDNMLFIADDGTIVDANEAAVECYGYTRDELLGLTIAALRAPETLGELPKQLQKAREEHIRFESVHIKKDGTRIPVEVSGSAAVVNGQRVVLGIIRDVRDRKAAERELHEAHKILDSVLTSAPIGIVFFDRDMRYRTVNPRLAEMNGLTVSDHIGKTVREIVPSLADKVDEIVAKIVRTGKPVVDVELEGETRLNPGERRFWNESWYPVLDESGEIVGFGAVVEDITARKRAEVKLRLAAESLSLAQRASGAGIWDWDISERDESYVSQEYRDLYGIGPDDRTTHETWLSRMHPEDRERINTYTQQLLYGNGTDYNTEFRILHPTRGERWLAGVGKVERNAAGEPVRFSGINIDITERKQAEEALRRAEKLAGAGRMAAVVAHEINNPLAAVVNVMYLLGQQPLEPLAKSYLETAAAELARVVHITRQTLAFYRYTDHAAVFDVVRIAAEVTEFFQPMADRSQARLENVVQGSHFVHGFTGEIRQVISNLVTNALEAGARRVRVRVHAARDVRHDIPLVRISVSDNGKGIAPRHLEKVFEPFFTTKGEKGTGLGLWVTRGIVAKHDGKIRVRSRAGRGTTISIWLPTAKTVPASQRLTARESVA